MQPYVQKWPRLVSMEDYLARAHPDAPALPWLADNGAEVCSFTVEPLPATGGIMVVLYDAHGREAYRSDDQLAIEATAVALGGRENELTFLPAAVRA